MIKACMDTHSMKDGFLGASGIAIDTDSTGDILTAAGGGEEHNIGSSGASVVGEIMGDSSTSVLRVALCGNGR